MIYERAYLLQANPTELRPLIISGVGQTPLNVERNKTSQLIIVEFTLALTWPELILLYAVIDAYLISTRTYTTATQLDASVTDEWNVLAVATDIATYTIPAWILFDEGNNIELYIVWTFAANANSKRVQVYLWTSLIYDTLAQGQNDWSFRLIAKVFKDWTSQKIGVDVWYSDEVTLFPDEYRFEATAVDMSISQIIKVVATWVDTNDIVKKFHKVFYNL